MPPCYPAVRIYNSGQRALARPRMGRSVGPKHDGPGGRSAYMGESTGRGLAKSVGRFSSRDLLRSFGFPILRNRVPMGFGRSNLDLKMHNFNRFDLVHSKHFFVNQILVRQTKIESGACQPPTARAAGPSIGRLGDSVRRQGRSRTLTTVVVNLDGPPFERRERWGKPHHIYLGNCHIAGSTLRHWQTACYSLPG
jgi:hypothetical protein